MHRKENSSIKRALTYFTFATTLLINSFAPQRSFSAQAKSPIVEPIRTTLSAKWSGGTCSLSTETGMVIYELKDGKAVSFQLPQNALSEEKPFFLSCDKDITVIVSQDRVAVVWRGVENPTGEIFKGVFSVMGMKKDEIGEPIPVAKAENLEEEKNIAVSKNEGDIYVLVKNIKTMKYGLVYVRKNGDGPLTYPPSEKFNGKVKLFVHNGIAFIGGEADKKQVFLVAVKIDKNNEASLLSFAAPKKFSGDVSFNVKDGKLFLNIGNDSIKIDIVSSKDEISDKNILCFLDIKENSNFLCISPHSKSTHSK